MVRSSLVIVAVGVLALPVPAVAAHIVLIMGGLPAQNLPALAGVGVAGGIVAAEDIQMIPLANGRLGDDEHEEVLVCPSSRLLLICFLACISN